MTTGTTDSGRGALVTGLANRSRHATFFCYHSISDGGPPFLSLSPETFERQLATMRRRGLGGGGVEALRELAEGRRPPRRQVFLTFDDGYLDNHETAAPLLAEYGFQAMVFVLPPYVDSAGAFDWPELAERQRAHPGIMRSMGWPMVEALAERGIEIGSHGLAHPHLPDLDDERLRDELWSSRERIRTRLGRCDVLAYPFGEWDERVAAAAADAGYSFAFSLPSQGQREGAALAIPRINIDQRDGGVRFAVKLSPLGRRAYLSGGAATVRRVRRRRAGSPPAALDARSCAIATTPSSPLRVSGAAEPGIQASGSILLVCSPGGHLLQLLSLEPAWRGLRRSWVTLAAADVDHLLEGEDVTLAHGPTNRSLRNLVRNLILAWREVRGRRPDTILSTGAALAVPFFVVGRLLDRRCVYVESLTRIESVSLSGRLVYPLADSFFVQWPRAAARRRMRYEGSIL